jgi:hypothetical protein
MNPEQYQKLKHLFAAAIQLDDTRRAAFLDEACTGDEELRREIASLLRHHHPATVIAPAPPAGGSPHRVPVAGGASPAATGETLPVGMTPREDLLPGSKVADRYRIAGLLGRGGMGEVYRADDLTLGQVVALKFLSRGRGADPAWLARFRDEVRIARKVTHPNVCRVYDIGEAGRDTFISMEYIDGEDLASLLRRIGRLPGDKAAQVARQVCAGLGAAHDQGVLHRDLKPANVMIDGLGQALITDFGIAAIVPRPGERTSVAGTPGYIAPELLAGRSPSQRSDVYSLGLVLYEMVTGRRAFAADTFEQRLAEAPPAPPGRWVEDLDPAFERVILRCLEEDPDARPPSAYAVAAALPGGDPLAAAMALGLTPSPDTVAGAGGTGVRVSAAIAWFAAAFVGLLVVVLLADRAFFLSTTGLNRAPAVLEEKARDVIAAVGRTQPAREGSYRFRIEPRIPEGRNAVSPASIISGRRESAREARIIFEYRQGESWAPPPGPLVAPVLFDVPRPVPGSRLVQLDTDGNLVLYIAFPRPVTTSQERPEPADWSVPFGLSGLRQEALTPMVPAHRPPMYADSVAAWEGAVAGSDGRRIRVAAAAIGPQITYFHVTEPGWPAEPGTGSSEVAAIARYLLFLLLLAGGAILAWRNLRSGRSDRRGAWRLAVFMLCLQGLFWTVHSPHALDLSVEIALITNALRSMVFTGVAIWIFYIGIEPQVRRLWPQSIISWSRVLLGRFGDPLVGRDLLTGVAAGIAIVLLREITVLLAHYSGWGVAGSVMPDTGADVGTVFGFRYGLEVISGALLLGIWMGLGLMLLMLLLRLVLKNAWLAALAFVVVGTAVLTLTSYSVQSLPWLTNGLVLLVLTWVLSRVGLLSAIISLFAAVLLTSLPLTFDVHAWFAGLTGLAFSVLGALLVLGLYVASQSGSPQQLPQRD